MPCSGCLALHGVNPNLKSISSRPCHDAHAIAPGHAVTHANQEKGGLGGR